MNDTFLTFFPSAITFAGGLSQFCDKKLSFSNYSCSSREHESILVIIFVGGNSIKFSYLEV
jgi:hypothetical protein